MGEREVTKGGWAQYRVDQLEGDLLDAAVAKADGLDARVIDGVCLVLGQTERWYEGHGIKIRGGFTYEHAPFQPCSDWQVGGPIIERERISVTYPEANPQQGYEWHANIARPEASFNTYGPTPLIAAMRAYVASRFGEEIELP